MAVSPRAVCQAWQPASATGVPSCALCNGSQLLFSTTLELRGPQIWLRGNFLGNVTLCYPVCPSGNPKQIQRQRGSHNETGRLSKRLGPVGETEDPATVAQSNKVSLPTKLLFVTGREMRLRQERVGVGSETEPEMEERNRLRESKARERRRDIPRSGGREERTQTIFRGKKEKTLTFAAHKGRKSCHEIQLIQTVDICSAEHYRGPELAVAANSHQSPNPGSALGPPGPPWTS